MTISRTTRGWSFDQQRKSFLYADRLNPISFETDGLTIHVHTNRETGEVDSVRVMHGDTDYSATFVRTGIYHLYSDKMLSQRLGPEGSFDVMSQEQKQEMVRLMIEAARIHEGPFPDWARPIWSAAVAFCRG